MPFREPHWCDECPKFFYPHDRPPTKQEVVAKWSHHYSDWPREKMLRYAVDDFTYQYAWWVNVKQWRKPPGWKAGSVPRHQVRAARQPLLLGELTKWRTKLLAEMRRRLRVDSPVQRGG